MPSMQWSRIAATAKAFHTRKRLRACSAAVEPNLIPASCKHSFPSPSRKPPTFFPLQERVCRQRARRRLPQIDSVDVQREPRVRAPRLIWATRPTRLSHHVAFSLNGEVWIMRIDYFPLFDVVSLRFPHAGENLWDVRTSSLGACSLYFL